MGRMNEWATTATARPPGDAGEAKERREGCAPHIARNDLECLVRPLWGEVPPTTNGPSLTGADGVVRLCIGRTTFL